MSTPRDPLAAFDDGVLATVAAREGLAESELRALVRRHQASVRSSPGVDNLVYEWRRGLAYDPVVARTERAYHVVLLDRVWAEFASELGWSDSERAALRAVHDRQARAATAARGDDTGVFDGGAPMVLTRP
jgi:hypothetical protein